MCVSVELHFGHSVVSVEKNVLPLLILRVGGAIPYALSLSFPSFEIQSDDQGGDKTRSTFVFIPF